MRKRILAIALATTMAFSAAVVSVPSYKNVAVAEAAVGDATVKDLDIDAAFSANTGVLWYPVSVGSLSVIDLKFTVFSVSVI